MSSETSLFTKQLDSLILVRCFHGWTSDISHWVQLETKLSIGESNIAIVWKRGGGGLYRTKDAGPDGEE